MPRLTRFHWKKKPARPAEAWHTAPLPPRFTFRLRKFITAHKQRVGTLPSTGEAIRILRGLDAGELFAVAVNAGVGAAWRAAAIDQLNKLELTRQRPGLRERERKLRAQFGLNVFRWEGAP